MSLAFYESGLAGVEAAALVKDRGCPVGSRSDVKRRLRSLSAEAGATTLAAQPEATAQ
jgi:hypothetical protein